MPEMIVIADNSGYDYINSVLGRINKNHARHLNLVALLPLTHAAVLANIVKGGRGGRTFVPLSEAYKKFKSKQIIKSDLNSKQPTHLGRQKAPSQRILVSSGKFFNNLGTVNQATFTGIVYSLNLNRVSYAKDVVLGRGSGTRMVTIPEHIRQAHNRILKSGKITWVKAGHVREQQKTITTGRIPARNPFYLIKSDTESVENVFEKYYTVSSRTKFVSIRTKMKFTANKRIKILPSKGRGVGRKILKQG